MTSAVRIRRYVPAVRPGRRQQRGAILLIALLVMLLMSIGMIALLGIR